ncbi:MAG: ankyrin repeat domain-containing protein [Planctomycetota bacterium]
MSRRKELHDAIESGNLSRIRSLLDSGLSPNGLDGGIGRSSLATACEYGNHEIITTLLDAGADPNYRRTTTPPLAIAASSGDLELIELLFQHGAAVDMDDACGGTALMDAASKGHLSIVKRLLDAGANPRLKDHERLGAIVYAAKKGHEAVVKLLSPISTASMREQAKRYLGAAKTEAHPGVEELLLFMGLPKRKRDGPVFDEVKRRIEDGVPVNGVAHDGRTLIMRAANRQNQTDVVKYLLDQGAEVNAIDVYGNSPLMYAALGERRESYELLYPLTDKKLRKRAERQKAISEFNGTWPE